MSQLFGIKDVDLAQLSPTCDLSCQASTRAATNGLSFFSYCMFSLFFCLADAERACTKRTLISVARGAFPGELGQGLKGRWEDYCPNRGLGLVLAGSVRTVS
jgi:hypothetical protein